MWIIQVDMIQKTFLKAGKVGKATSSWLKARTWKLLEQTSKYFDGFRHEINFSNDYKFKKNSSTWTQWKHQTNFWWLAQLSVQALAAIQGKPAHSSFRLQHAHKISRFFSFGALHETKSPFSLKFMGERSFRDRTENELQSMGVLVIAQTSSFPRTKNRDEKFSSEPKLYNRFSLFERSRRPSKCKNDSRMTLKKLSLNELPGKKKKFAWILLDGGSMFESKWRWLGR